MSEFMSAPCFLSVERVRRSGSDTWWIPLVVLFIARLTNLYNFMMGRTASRAAWRCPALEMGSRLNQFWRRRDDAPVS